MLLNKIAIVMTDKCSAACDMCCFGCSPHGKMRLSTELMKDVIRQASETESVNSVGFTGGEPFLFFEQLKECAAYAKSMGLRVTVNTNGFWGKNEERALEMARELSKTGVECISFSADRYHKRFVPIKDLQTAMRVTIQAGIGLEVSVMETVGSDDIVQMTEALRPEIYRARIINHPMLPVGKALETVSNENYITEFESRNAKCTFDGLFQLNFDGNYYMCCSQFCREIPPIKLGSANEVPLSDLERKISSNDYLYVMLLNGFGWYIDLAKEFGYTVPEHICSACHCCYYIFRNEEFLEKAKDRITKEAGRLRVRQLFKRYGDRI